MVATATQDSLIDQIRDELGKDAAMAFDHAIKFNKLADALRRYGQHDDDCRSLSFGHVYCTCGFSDVLDFVEA